MAGPVREITYSLSFRYESASFQQRQVLPSTVLKVMKWRLGKCRSGLKSRREFKRGSTRRFSHRHLQKKIFLYFFLKKNNRLVRGHFGNLSSGQPPKMIPKMLELA
jgi:hypothetical protein